MTLRDCPNTTRTHKSRAITVDSCFVLIGTRVSSCLLISIVSCFHLSVQRGDKSAREEGCGWGVGSIFCIGHILGGTLVVHGSLLALTSLFLKLQICREYVFVEFFAKLNTKSTPPPPHPLVIISEQSLKIA